MSVANPVFGEWLRNIHASPTNPQRDGMYIRTVVRPRGSVNAGKCYRLTDGKGNFWTCRPDGLERLDREVSDAAIKVRRIGEHTLPLPSRAHDDDAGLDLRNAGPRVVLPCAWQLQINIGGMQKVFHPAPGYNVPAWLPVGFAFAIPRGYEGQVRGRSGLARKHGVVAFHLGTIDASFRGEVHVALVNHGTEDFVIEHGDRIAQLVIAPVSLASCVEGDLDETARGDGGFGSSGVK